MRRAAVARVDDPDVLVRVATSDTDAEARERATEKLLALATTGSEAAALVALRGLTDPRQLSTVAKSDVADAVRTEALARITDDRALGAIARHAHHESTAAVALSRLGGRDDLLEVALNGDHKDLALAAFERAVPADAGADALDVLRTIESRSQQKAVARRARTMIQAIEAAEADRAAAAADRQRREAALCEDVERLAGQTDRAALLAELDRLDAAWRGLEVTDEAALTRFTAAVTAARETVARLEVEAEAAADLARQRAEAIATRDALCQRVETLDGDDVLAQLVPIEEEWRSLMPLVGDGPEADRLAERFAQAVAACRTRYEMGAQLAETRETLAGLVAEAEGLPSLEDAGAAAERWQALSREARGLAAALAAASRPATDLAARWKVVEEVFAARALNAQEAGLKAQQHVLQQLQRLVERATRVAEAENITLREGERLMRDIKAGFDAATAAESTSEMDDAVKALHGLQEKVAPRVRELREMDEWRRFANAQRQEQLIAMAEAIVASLKADEEAGKESDLAATARALRELHTKWQEVAEAPRHSAQRLWERFRTATDAIRGRCEGYFVKLRAERVENIHRKQAITEEAETLAQSSDWAKAAARFQALQEEWKAIGPTSKDAGRQLAQRFRAACNTFFARRREDMASRKKTWTENLTRKEALCERAEALAESTDWDAAASEMKRLQAEWKTIGPVRRNKSETIWTRFRGAADTFFERYHNRHNLALAGKLAEREALVVDLEALLALEDAPADLADKVQQLRGSWTRGVPVPVPGMKELTERWHTAFAAVATRWPDALKGTEFDPQLVRQRLEKLVTRVEGFAEDVRDSAPKGVSQTELLAQKLRSALASNAMGGRSSEEGKWRAAAEAVRDAQASWQRLAPIAGEAARDLEPRFRDACRKVNEHARRHAGPPRRSQRTTTAAAV
ncbi:MAG: DUF349 domain-containing protein [Vicinamibacterales bacterium]